MNLRTLTATAALLLMGMVVGAAAFSTAGARAQQVGNPASEVGRYRIATYAPGGGVYMNDTATGECWLLNMTAKKWVRTAAPIGEK